MSPQELLALADRVEEIEGGFSNAIDVQCEIALFEPDDCELAIRANAAGSKVIVTINGGPDRTFIAGDFTLGAVARRNTAARLRSLATTRSQHEGAE